MGKGETDDLEGHRIASHINAKPNTFTYIVG